MSTEVVKGIVAFSLNQTSRRWEKERGWYTEKTYAGPQSELAAFEQYCIDQGADSVTSTKSVPCVVVASFPEEGGVTSNPDADAESNANWELIPEVIERRIESFGAFNRSGSSPYVIALINAALNDGSDNGIDWEATYSNGDYNDFRDLKAMGVETYQTHVYRVRKSVILTRKSSVRAVFDNVGKVIPWADIGVPANAMFGQPSVHTFDPNTAAFADVSLDDWLVMPPSVRWLKGSKRWSVEQEWVGQSKWSGTLYDGGHGVP